MAAGVKGDSKGVGVRARQSPKSFTISTEMTPRESFGEFDATSLFCPRCRRATPVRSKLLLVLPSGNKYDYVCAECGTPVGGKTDNDSSEFYRTAPSGRVPPRSGRR
jgi:hypothetical protein